MSSIPPVSQRTTVSVVVVVRWVKRYGVRGKDIEALVAVEAVVVRCVKWL